MAAPIPFVPPIEVTYGEAEQVSPLVRRITADNPSKYTYLGTGTYIIGRGDVAVIDPGPKLDAHRDALAAALRGERVRAILITHTHADHSPLAAWLATETGAPTYGFGPHGAIEFNADADVKLEESVDVDFVPSAPTVDGDRIVGPGWTVEAIHTPGHCSNHLCFTLEQESTLFSGDHVMGWSTAVISPPDGDMTTYFDSLRKLLDRTSETTYRPTHGGPILDPHRFVEAYLSHRLAREQQILSLVRRRPITIADIVAELYAEVRVELHKPAARSVLAHLVKLIDDGLVEQIQAPADDTAAADIYVAT